MTSNDQPKNKVYNWQLGKTLNLVATYVVNDFTRGIYSDMLEGFCQLLRKRNKANWQNIIVIQGRTGSGKSTLALQIAKQLDPNWEVSENYIYSVDDLRAKLKKARVDPLNVSPVSLFDEGTVALSNKNFMRNEDKGIITLLETMRSLRWTTIICVPNFWSLNKAIRENLTDYLITCPDKPLIQGYATRGFFQVFKPDYARWTDGVYWTHIGSGIYPDLKGDFKDEYESIKLKHQMELTKKFIEGDEKKSPDKEKKSNGKQ